jgi:hypothetical protein
VRPGIAQRVDEIFGATAKRRELDVIAELATSCR